MADGITDEEQVIKAPPCCPDCGNHKLIKDYQKAEVICNECGLVIRDKIMDTGPEWRAYNPEQKEKRGRGGSPTTISIHDKVKELIEAGKVKVVIDLSNVVWMNSSGLGTMMGCLTSLKNANGDLKLSGVTEKVKSLFMVTKLITIFNTYKNSEEAIEAFK